ncbi:DUF4118 domain-containing protein [Bradyrhizobium guangdongense]|uniref:Sensor protein KdpD transmembrane domain-containing protein n=1 Tax=Bradyrhizobium guangdongense TaxID=1325090 RepID=A0A410V4C0_9BRAD|nr:DUF4118 domain-containing protein [Bradyrhizobium guangdongense]QAU38514.1 hypothetical protein X265_13145 [Bradyrhizobium guangdongense]QOZ59574.1 hypothetical protein XH86_13150 [Bradyrhizobium guangdongense]GGI33832.1 hypothetical protein GCM10010987_76350 [Bradyrhizobium guangdongense]
MSYTSDRLVSTLATRPNRWAFRGLAYVLLPIIAFANTQLGGVSWVSYLGVFVIGCLATYILPSTTPVGAVRAQVVALLTRLYSWPLRYQMAAAVVIFVAIEILDHYAGGFKLGRIFNIYMAAVFSHALVFGLRSSLLMWLLATLTVYYAEVPPEYSFKLETIAEFAEIFVFMYLGLLALASAYFFRISSIIGDGLDERR